MDGLAGRPWYRRWWIAAYIAGIVVLALAGGDLASPGRAAQLAAIGTLEASKTAPQPEAGSPSPTPTPTPSPSAVAVTPTPSPTKKAGGSNTGSGGNTGNHTLNPHLSITFASFWSGGPFGAERVKVHLVVMDATSAQRTTVIVHWIANGVGVATSQRTFNGGGTFDATFEHVFDGCGITPSARLDINATPSAAYTMPFPVDLPPWLCGATPPPVDANG